MNNILKNKIQCKRCKQTIQSKKEDHLVKCKCGLVSADGGRSFLRRHGAGFFIDMSEIEECVKCGEYLVWYQDSALPGMFVCPKGCR